MLVQAYLPLKFWPDVFSTTVYLINRLPIKALRLKCPMEVMFKTKPEYKTHKVFGCLSFPYLRSYNKHKLNFRSSPSTFLGYATNQKGYRCLDKNGKIFISRHVVFNEREIPFSKTSESTTSASVTQKCTIPDYLYSVYQIKVMLHANTTQTFRMTITIKHKTVPVTKVNPHQNKLMLKSIKTMA